MNKIKYKRVLLSIIALNVKQLDQQIIKNDE